MSKKNQRLRQARDRLVELASEGAVSCSKHDEVLRPYQVYYKKCYQRNGRAVSCKYLRYKK